MYLQKDKQASPTFWSLSIGGTTLNCHWLQISLSIARSHRQKHYPRQLWWRKEHLPPLLTCLPATDLGNWKNKRTAFGASLLLPTWSCLNSHWLTDGPCMLLGLLTRISRYIYSHSGVYISYLLRSWFCCQGQHQQLAARSNEPCHVLMTSRALHCLNLGDSLPWFPTIMSWSPLTKSYIPSV